jgi:hypothetical protein
VDRPIWQYRAGAIPKVRRQRQRRGAAWPCGRREAAAGGWKTGEAAAYPGPDDRQMLRRAGEGSGATGNSATLGLVQIRDGLGKGSDSGMLDRLGKGGPATCVVFYRILINFNRT